MKSVVYSGLLLVVAIFLCTSRADQQGTLLNVYVYRVQLM